MPNDSPQAETGSPSASHAARIGARAHVDADRADVIIRAVEALPAGRRLSAPSVLPPLGQALAAIDAVFSIRRILRNEGVDLVQHYYSVSGLGYRRVHSPEGCMHMALSDRDGFRPGDYLAQAQAIERLIRGTGARRVLELGFGQGFNLLHLARRCPDVDFTGIDVVAGHVARARRAARDLRNAHFIQGSFEAIPPDLADYDLVFSVEALCHASDLSAVAGHAARVLAPGGMFVVFDAVRAAPLTDMPEEMATAVRLFETVTAVSCGFREEAALTHAFTAAGLTPVRVRDLSRGVIPGLRRLHDYAQRYFASRHFQLATRLLPAALRRNAAGALLGPYLIEAPQPGLRYLAAAFTR